MLKTKKMKKWDRGSINEHKPKNEKRDRSGGRLPEDQLENQKSRKQEGIVPSLLTSGDRET